MDVAEWLHRLGLEQYAPTFRQNDIGGELLADLTADDLKDLGVASVGHRRRLLAAIAELRAGDAAVDGRAAVPVPDERRPRREPNAASSR